MEVSGLIQLVVIIAHKIQTKFVGDQFYLFQTDILCNQNVILYPVNYYFNVLVNGLI